MKQLISPASHIGHKKHYHIGSGLLKWNGYQFGVSRIECTSQGSNPGAHGRKEAVVLALSISMFTGSIIALGAIVSAKPLEHLAYKGWTEDQHHIISPYASSVYLGWAMASAFALIVTGVLPILSWFATYRFSLSSTICVVIFAVVLVALCGTSYLEVVNSRNYEVPTDVDFLAALLPLMCIPAALSLGSGLLKWKDDDWKFSQGVCVFIGIGLLLLLGAISAIIITVKPWTIGVACLLVLLLIVLAIGVIHYWAANNFYLTRAQMFLVCFFAFLLALAAFVLGLLEGKPFVGASVGYFSFLFLLAGRALSVLLSPPIVVYSPRVFPVYVYDAHADCAKNVSGNYWISHPWKPKVKQTYEIKSAMDTSFGGDMADDSAGRVVELLEALETMAKDNQAIPPSSKSNDLEQ